ncbi:DUF7500 family protein [Halorarum salinum]|uniref:Flagella cluster protein n=1 Tax=Halorarum salinum TaxID=2743089 RepID=A0A7D5Q8J5_9EURY|nr:hypothetical protein [Halobaculum salinum]QLG61017.1 hypothetical protein HUG12_04400 [Halobaculum salinum]
MTDDVGDPALDPDDLDISKSEYVRELGEDRYVVSPGRAPPREPRSEPAEEPRPADRPTESSRSDASAGTPAAESPPRPVDDREDSTDTTTKPEPSRTGEPTDGEVDPSDPPKRDATPRTDVKRGAPSRRTSRDDASAEVDAAAVGRWLAESLADAEFEYGFDATLSIEDEAVRHRMVSNDVTTTFETLALWFSRAAAGEGMTPERALGILLAEMDAGVTLPAVALRRAVDRHGLTAEDSIGDLLRAAEEEDGLTLE